MSLCLAVIWHDLPSHLGLKPTGLQVTQPSLVVDLLEVPGTKRACFHLRAFAPAVLVLGSTPSRFHNLFSVTHLVTHQCFQMLTLLARLSLFSLTQVKLSASPWISYIFSFSSHNIKSKSTQEMIIVTYYKHQLATKPNQPCSHGSNISSPTFGTESSLIFFSAYFYLILMSYRIRLLYFTRGSHPQSLFL